MITVLAFAAVAVLAALGLLSLKKQRETGAVEKQEAGVRARTGEAQRNRSMDRRAAIRSGSDASEHALVGADSAPADGA
jgi:hypothetical protein